MTFNPAEKRDVRGRWSLEQAIEAAIKGLGGNTLESKSDGLNYAKAAYHKASEMGDDNARRHIRAALNAKKPAKAVAQLHDALSGKASRPSTTPLTHERHGLSLHVARELTNDARKRLGSQRGNVELRHQVKRARTSLPTGHPARFHLGNAYHAGTQAQVQAHLKRAMSALGRRTRLPEGADVRHERAASSYATKKLSRAQ